MNTMLLSINWNPNPELFNGHCLFYDPGYYLSHFWEMILPIKFMPDGNWKFTGYEGLASHGGTLGLIIALWLYCRKTKLHYMDVLDMIAVATPITEETASRLLLRPLSDLYLHLPLFHRIPKRKSGRF